MRSAEISTLSLPDALPIYIPAQRLADVHPQTTEIPILFQAEKINLNQLPELIKKRSQDPVGHCRDISPDKDRKSTRLNSSHVRSSYAVFCSKKKIHRSVIR